ncbi:GNAT family N-acetyltransferase [Providencia burhodogranariea]|uniref:N-acetyltransferase GCN5 n=1 Tax=Providencia burhodogranariea DSM 19968 TaxID=1141662 RepID=K8WN86_9GAMM|nr:GNAT family protein [Providencia burhodogranariea]EKT62029.1 N-acetyltransferase GCN5 [Providencia burhodogranariea DSM 19968]
MNCKNEFNQEVGAPIPEWKNKQYPVRVTLKGNHCTVEALKLAHANELYNAINLDTDDSYWTWLTREPIKNKSDFSQWVEHVISVDDPIFYVVIDHKTNQPIGYFALMRIDPNNGVVEVGHVHFSKLLRGTIMSTEAHWLLMNYVFTDLKYRRYEWKCNSLNVPSRNAALRLGFKYEGRFRQSMVVKGHNRDTDWLSIIDSEWHIVNQSIKQWLSPSNFDLMGNQLRSLNAIQNDNNKTDVTGIN